MMANAKTLTYGSIALKSLSKIFCWLSPITFNSLLTISVDREPDISHYSGLIGLTIASKLIISMYKIFDAVIPVSLD